MGRKKKRTNTDKNIQKQENKQNLSFSIHRCDGIESLNLKLLNDRGDINSLSNKTPKNNLENNNCDGNNKISNKSSTTTDNSPDLLSDLKLKVIKNENSNKNNENGVKKCRDCFISYLCQVCKSKIDIREECKKCQMISYCSTAHRRNHWATHADLCNAIQDVCKMMNKQHILEGITNNNNAEQFKQYCYNLMLECQKRVQRTLEEWEVELFLYPNVCETCFNWNKEQLNHCNICNQSSFCKSEHQNKNHKSFCNSLIMYRKIVQYQHKNGPIKVYFPETFVEKDIKLDTDINSILKKAKLEINELEYLQLTEIATGPLTAAYALKLFHQKQNKVINNTISIHVIGAETHFELNLLEKWEIFFLHYFIQLRNINIIFIGPEININKEHTPKNISLCEKCKKLNRKINFQFFDKTLYHNYCNLSNYIRPDLICAFNAGLYRETGYEEKDTWPESIKSMFKTQNIPVLVTAYTSVEISKDLERIKKIQKNIDIIKTPSQNSYSSLKPNLNFVSYEDTPVIFKNYYILLLEKP